MRFFAAALIFFGVAASSAQTPEVPHKINFAGMSLTIRDDARREIQKDVDALTRHKGYFEINAERAKTYFPIIERIFREEQLPEDFKFLALQESSLTPDAVSVSNAVGFWQFKDYTAQEMGLRVDKQIDERMNIASATRGAARYIKQNNYRFNNWLLALQAYQMGAGGVERAVGDKYNGDRHMEITSETYWYVKKYLAHKVAFENACHGSPKLSVSLYETTSERRLADIAAEVAVEENTLKEYNKWVRRGTIPDDKPYLVAIPGGVPTQEFSGLVLSSSKASKAKPTSKKTKPSEARILVNGVEAIIANAGETVSALAARSGLNISQFIQYNDMSIDQEVRPGSFYFLKRKKKKNLQSMYRAKIGDDLWSVSQQFGVRLKNLKKLNPGIDESLLVSGSVVRLNNSEAAPKPVLEVEQDEVAKLSTDTFNWGIQPDSKTAVSTAKVEVAPEILPADTVTFYKNALIAQSKDTVIRHEVKKGETLYSIAHFYDVSVSSLIKDNQLNVADRLRQGQLIIVNKSSSTKGADVDPAQLSAKNEMFVYEVKDSDTLYGIARQFGATVKEIMDWNNKTVLAVSAGEKLKILRR